MTQHDRLLIVDFGSQVTQLIARGAETNIVYHGVSIPNVWVPPLVGTQFIEAEVRDQYRELRDEIMRRKRIEGR